MEITKKRIKNREVTDFKQHCFLQTLKLNDFGQLPEASKYNAKEPSWCIGFVPF
jgi:hypothetical protein